MSRVRNGRNKTGGIQVQSHPVVPDGQNQELTVRDNETSGRVVDNKKRCFEKEKKLKSE